MSDDDSRIHIYFINPFMQSISRKPKTYSRYDPIICLKVLMKLTNSICQDIQYLAEIQNRIIWYKSLEWYGLKIYYSLYVTSTAECKEFSV
jgi:hypothetical protein